MLPPEFAEAWQCIAHLHRFSQTLKQLGDNVGNEQAGLASDQQSDLDSRDQPYAYAQQLKLEKERRATAESELQQAQQLLKRSYGQLVDELLQTTQQLHSQTQRIQQLEEELATFKNPSKASSPDSQHPSNLLVHSCLQTQPPNQLNAVRMPDVRSAADSPSQCLSSNHSSPEDKSGRGSRQSTVNTTTPTKPYHVLQQTPLIIPGSGSRPCGEASHTSSTLVSPDQEQEQSNSHQAARRVAELLESLRLPADHSSHPPITTTPMDATSDAPRRPAYDLHVYHPTDNLEHPRCGVSIEQGGHDSFMPNHEVSAFGFGAQTRLERVAAALSAVRGSSALLPTSNQQVKKGLFAANGHSPSPSYPPPSSAVTSPDSAVSSSFLHYGYSTQKSNDNAYDCNQRDTGRTQGIAAEAMSDIRISSKGMSKVKQDGPSEWRAKSSSNPGAASSHSIRFSSGSSGGFRPELLNPNDHSPLDSTRTPQQQHLSEETDALRYLRTLRQQHSLPSYHHELSVDGGLQSSTSDALPAAHSYANASKTVLQHRADDPITNHMNNRDVQYGGDTWQDRVNRPAVGPAVNIAPPSAQASFEGELCDVSELSDWETVGESEEQQACSPVTDVGGESALYQHRHKLSLQSDKASYTATSATSHQAILKSSDFTQPNGQSAAGYDSSAATRARSSLASYSDTSSAAIHGRVNTEAGWRGQMSPGNNSAAVLSTPAPVTSRESSRTSMRDAANSPSLEMSSDELFRSIKQQLACLQATFPQVHI